MTLDPITEQLLQLIPARKDYVISREVGKAHSWVSKVRNKVAEPKLCDLRKLANVLGYDVILVKRDQ